MMAALQTMRFGHCLQFVALLLELSGIMLVGTVVGVAAALAVLALAALVWPAMQVARLKPIDYLRG